VLSLHATVTTSLFQLPVSGKNDGSLQYSFGQMLASVTFNGTSPFCAVYCAAAPAAIISCVNNNNGTYTALIWTWSIAAVVEFYVFDQANTVVSTLPCGLRVYNASRQLIADAGQRFLRIIDVQSGNVANAGSGWGETGFPNDFTNTYSYAVTKVAAGGLITACALQSVGGNNANGQNMNGFMGLTGWQCNGGTAQMCWRGTSQGGVSSGQNYTGYTENLGWRASLIDVSFI
jgi:hypothetical protein